MKKSLCLLLLFIFVGTFSNLYAGKIPIRGYVNANNGLNIRASASTKAKILKAIVKNTQVSILDAVGNWYKISAESVVGYVYASYITVTETGDDFAEGNSDSLGNSDSSSGSFDSATSSSYVETSNIPKATKTGRNLNKSAINATITNVP